MKRFWIFKAIAFVILAILALGAVTMLLWNWLVPPLFNGPTISFGQAVGLLVLAKILLGNFGRGHWGGGYMTRKRAWKHKFEEKWRNMTPEEREQFKATMKNRCSKWGWMSPESKLEKA